MPGHPDAVAPVRHRPPPLSRGVALLLVLLCSAPGCGGTDEGLVLLLTSDTRRADRLGGYGGPQDLTPNLDALLAESVVFASAFAPCSYTLPSVSALMTGRHPEELGLASNTSRVGTDFATLAGVLDLHGWRTGAVVSNYVLREGTGISRGFEHYDATFPDKEANRDMPERTAGDTTDAALHLLDRMREGDSAPLFLWVHYQDPHGPYLPPEGHRERFLEAERRVPDGSRWLDVAGQSGVGSIPLYQYVEGQHEVAFYRAGYDGEVSYLDQELGRLLEGVDARGLLADAVVVFTADHGEGMGENEYWFAHGEFLTDPLVRVPLAVRAPGLAPGQRGDVAGLVDLFPTVLALAGIEQPGGYPGRDLLAAGAEEAEPEIYLAGLRHASVPRFGLIADGYKYLRSEGRIGTVEHLYRLGDEEKNLGLEEPERLAELRQRLARLRAGLRRVPERRQELTETERERLRALGYVVE